MALNDPTQKSIQADVGISCCSEEPESGFEEEEDEENEKELEKLELEVKQMAAKILELRATLPGQLGATLGSLLSAQRSVFANLDPTLDAGPSTDSNAAEQASTLTEEDQKAAEKMQLLKDKVSSNISALPAVLSRLKECMSKIDELDTCNGIIHSCFKKKKTKTS